MPLALFPPFPHQNAFNILSIESIRVEGGKKILMTYEGIDCKTDFIITSLYALYKHLLIQEFIYCQNLSWMKLKVACLFLPIIEGKQGIYLFLEPLEPQE